MTMGMGRGDKRNTHRNTLRATLCVCVYGGGGGKEEATVRERNKNRKSSELSQLMMPWYSTVLYRFKLDAGENEL